MYLLIILILALPNIGWAQNTATVSSEKQNDSKVVHTIFLVGNTGAPADTGAGSKLQLLKKQLQTAGKASNLVFIGNTFYPRLLPPVNDPQRMAAEQALKAQLNSLKGYPGQVHIIPGDHESKKDKNNAERHARNQEQFIREYLQNEGIFLPESGCPGPELIEINENLLLVLLDTKWFLPRSPKINEDLGCSANSAAAALAEVDDILKSNPQKQVVIASHIAQDIKPFTYRAFQKGYAEIFRQHAGLIYAEDSSPALEYAWQDSINYIRTGVGSLTRRIKQKIAPLFTHPQPGFAKILFYENGEAWLEFWTAASNTDLAGKMAFRRLLMQKATLAQLNANIKPTPVHDYADSMVTANASSLYQVSKFKQWLLGKNYRPEWITPVTLPVFDVSREKGGLKVVQRGGGFQTRSLRLVDADGKEYVVRSVEKYPIEAIPRALRRTIAADIVKDQISASHPYAPLVVPTLAQAAGVYHTNPKYVFIPDDPRLGNFRTGLANTIALFEERPDDDESQAPHFGRSKKVYSTEKVLEKTLEDNDDQVDQKAVLRARLFDFFIGDWDRHEDQWRWASFENENGKGKYYQPIPRDRDMTFFVNQGIIPKIASRKWILPKIQGFDEAIRDVTTFNFNARYFDRTFLTELALEDWQTVAADVQQRLTDEIIQAALNKLPAPIYKIRGEAAVSILKARRARLVKDATDYYKFLARAVDVIGSNKAELFEVTRQDDEHTLIRVHKISKSGQKEQVIYERVFKTSETHEVRLYGLGDNDQFTLMGSVKRGILIRIIGGEGEDSITDNSQVKKGFKKTIVYDTATGNHLQLASEAKNETSDRDEEINEYDRKSFKYNYLGPLASIEYNKDDGFYLGGGFLAIQQGFRKEPFAASHRFVANYALATHSFLFNYAGYFTKSLGIFDVALNLDVKTRNFSDNFFGLSNESVYNQEFDIDYYRYRSERYHFNVLLGRQWGKYQQVLFGPAYEFVQVQHKTGSKLEEFNPKDLSSNDPFAGKSYAGLLLSYVLDSRDNKTLPNRGAYFQADMSNYLGTNSTSTNYSRINAQVAFFQAVYLPFKVVLAGRVGGGTTLGDFEFFQANTLDGLYNVRGFRRSRYSGRTSFYNNLEARIRLFSFQTYLFPGEAGIMAFHDGGRVWNDKEKSNKWHRGYGGGFWFAPVNLIVITAGYMISDENRLPLISAGFLF
ncbi:BamA/TamA family outer membrane protein [Adhaeribacter radiodurans]|uniref:BamA/TamA family outer membrane protein n=1 Tax=Adhaeribacter radiodurans TaxID=2745197 RepID=A0A7L7LFK8_9BACT|nr:BamA/TamA family outer membrane protein [Adhaeribacter radiodurans]QMU31295.1 BamA/TamA family outer membrane protein [Adhaeribacter radiodurans]